MDSRQWYIEIRFCCKSKEYTNFWKKTVHTTRNGDQRHREVLRHFESILLRVPVLGDPTLSNISFEQSSYWNDDMQLQPCTLLDLKGINIQAVLQCPCLDVSRLYCNNICQVEELLDVHAAKLVTFREMKRVYEYNGQYVNDAHLREMVDFMSRKGVLLAFTRTGFNEEASLGFMKKMSFEKILQHILIASQAGDVDSLDNIISNVLIGKIAPIGTRVPRVQSKIDSSTVPLAVYPWLDALANRNHDELNARLLPDRHLPEKDTLGGFVTPDYSFLKVQDQPMQTTQQQQQSRAQKQLKRPVSTLEPGINSAQLLPIIQSKSSEIVRLLRLPNVYQPKRYSIGILPQKHSHNSRKTQTNQKKLKIVP